MKSLLLKRFESDQNKTLGHMQLVDDGCNFLTFCTLELPWKDNQKSISCIPQGNYICKNIIRPNRSWALHLQDVPNRSEVLIHSGNYTTDIRGCILIGLHFNDINHDGITDVTGSVTAMKILERWAKDEKEIPLRIIGNMTNTKGDEKTI
jgi:hypothetical protein